ncbi:MAG TPA: DUF4265 domain-containing protein [Edaphobacter sp.]
MSEPVEVFFSVKQDESGYPPVSCEQIWCIENANDLFVIDNIPFYATDVSLGDEIRAEVRDGARWFGSLVKASRNTTLRIFARNKEIAPLIIRQLETFGGLTERMEDSGLIAVSLPPTADIAGALAYLDRESDAENLAFEESSVRYR